MAAVAKSIRENTHPCDKYRNSNFLGSVPGPDPSAHSVGVAFFAVSVMGVLGTPRHVRGRYRDKAPPHLLGGTGYASSKIGVRDRPEGASPFPLAL